MDHFTALADPTRRHILEMLASGGQLNAGAIGKHFDCSPPAISQHLKILREAALVRMEKQGQQRLYSLNPKALDEVERWLARMRQDWIGRFDALDAFLQSQDKP